MSNRDVAKEIPHIATATSSATAGGGILSSSARTGRTFEGEQHIEIARAFLAEGNERLVFR
jgi:hypothetical protein